MSNMPESVSTNPAPNKTNVSKAPPAKAKAWADIEEESSTSKKLTLLEKALFTEDADKQVKALRLRVATCCSALGSNEPEIRGGGLKTLMSILIDSTQVRKQDLRQFHRHGVASVVGDREAKKLAEEGVSPTKKADSKEKAKVNPLKAKLLKDIEELQKKYPADQRGSDSEYAKEVHKLREAYAASRKAQKGNGQGSNS
jgi:hypothetical protein